MDGGETENILRIRMRKTDEREREMEGREAVENV